MLLLTPFKFQNPIRKWRETRNGKRKWEGITYLINISTSSSGGVRGGGGGEGGLAAGLEKKSVSKQAP